MCPIRVLGGGQCRKRMGGGAHRGDKGFERSFARCAVGGVAF